MGGLVAVAIPATIIGGIAAGGVALWNIFFKWLSTKNLSIYAKCFFNYISSVIFNIICYIYI